MIVSLTSAHYCCINVNVAAVVALIKRDASFTVKNVVHSVGISSGSAHKNLTQQ